MDKKEVAQRLWNLLGAEPLGPPKPVARCKNTPGKFPQTPRQGILEAYQNKNHVSPKISGTQEGKRGLILRPRLNGVNPTTWVKIEMVSYRDTVGELVETLQPQGFSKLV